MPMNIRNLNTPFPMQESLASELAARMNAMQNASDNAKELRKVRRMHLILTESLRLASK